MYEKEVEAYKKFRNERLVPDRNLLNDKLNLNELEIKDYERLKDHSHKLLNCETVDDASPVTIKLDLGQGYSADFQVFDKDFVLVAVGFGFYCQMTWREAQKFCDSKIKVLQRNRDRFSKKLKKLEEHLKLTEEIITQLSK